MVKSTMLCSCRGIEGDVKVTVRARHLIRLHQIGVSSNCSLAQVNCTTSTACRPARASVKVRLRMPSRGEKIMIERHGAISASCKPRQRQKLIDRQGAE